MGATFGAASEEMLILNVRFCDVAVRIAFCKALLAFTFSKTKECDIRRYSFGREGSDRLPVIFEDISNEESVSRSEVEYPKAPVLVENVPGLMHSKFCGTLLFDKQIEFDGERMVNGCGGGGLIANVIILNQRK